MLKPKSTQQELQQKLTTLKDFAHKVEIAESQDLQQLMEQMVSTYPEQLYQCVEKGKELYKANPNKDFFVMSALKREPLTPKIFKQQFFSSLECPRPYLNFTLFKYHRKTGQLELIWSIPDRETLNHYYNNRIYASPEDWVILKDVIAYKDGSLYKKMRELNKESDDKPSLIVHDKSVFH